MSANHELLFPASDAMILSESLHLAEYQNFSQQKFLETTVDGLFGADLLHELDSFKQFIQPDFGADSCLKVLNNDKHDQALLSWPPDSSIADHLPTAPVPCEAHASLQSSQSCNYSSSRIYSKNSNSHFCMQNDYLQCTPLVANGMKDETEKLSLRDDLATKKLNYFSSTRLQKHPNFHAQKICNGHDYSGAAVHRHNNKRQTSSLATSTVQATMHQNVTHFNVSDASDGDHRLATDRIMKTERAITGGLASPMSGSSISRPDDVENILVQDDIKQSKSIFMAREGVAFGTNALSFSDIVMREDILPPLPPPSNDRSRSYLMHKSPSSHNLGQLTPMDSRQLTPMDSRPEVPSSSINTSNSSSSNLLSDAVESAQSQRSDFQGVNLRSIIPAMRRVYSAGDIETLNGVQLSAGRISPLSPAYRGQDEGGLKVGRYNSKERKIRITRYRQKRLQRNFDKKIKYACRKTLADSRPRVRGRFTKNYDAGENHPKRIIISHENDDEEIDLLADGEDIGFDEGSWMR
ncbi:hypothetical protein O6H91_05G107700 [Diphasiastrum complanatum]|uniref:Uncharacterized protein n=1 Tax=Diphasiastrum complanatum TaxID=34168 RepID=A0ACC2DS05_DIPCM|nr:hypothetical protein O6H91_05G107700 [Diphasiastrum complanatum]